MTEARTATLSCHDMSVTFGDFVAIRGASVCLSGHQVTGLAGVNGAGKTTLIHALMGLTPPSAGRVYSSNGLRSVAYCPDTPAFEPWLDASEVLEQSLAVARSDRSVHSSHEGRAMVLKRVGLAEVGRRRVGGFSRGMKQRLGIAAAVVLDPEILILDEPTSALDPLGREDVLGLISELGRAMHVVFSSHLLDDIEKVANSLIVLDRGEVVFTGLLSDFVNAPAAQLAITVGGDVRLLLAAFEARGIGCSVDPGAPGTLCVPESLRHRVFEVLAAHPDQIRSVESSQESLQSAFVRLIRARAAGGDDT